MPRDTGMPTRTLQKARSLLALGAGLLAAFPVQAASLQDRIVAVVNTEVITLSELEEEVGDAKAQVRQRYREAELTQRLRQIDYMGLNRMIERKLQLQIAKRRGIKVTEEEVKDAIVRLRRLGEKPDENDPKEMALIKDQLTALRLINQQVQSSLLVSGEEVLRYYQQHRDRFMLPPEVRISQILIALGPGSELLDVREKAQEVYALIKKGERFEELAAKYSDGPEGRRGGSLGYIRPGDMLPQIQKAIEQAPPGSVTEPIASSIGMHIIRVDDRKPPQFRPFEEVKEDVRNLVYQLKSEEAYIEWIKEQKDKNYIEIRL
jgi:parvulin-like peptidyl-prolyl isomerase